MNEELILKNRLKEARAEAKLSQQQLADMVVYQEIRSVRSKQDNSIQQPN